MFWIKFLQLTIPFETAHTYVSVQQIFQKSQPMPPTRHPDILYHKGMRSSLFKERDSLVFIEEAFFDSAVAVSNPVFMFTVFLI